MQDCRRVVQGICVWEAESFVTAALPWRFLGWMRSVLGDMGGGDGFDRHVCVLPRCQAMLYKGRDVRRNFFRVRQRPMVGALGCSDHLPVGRSRSKTIGL